MTDKHTDTHNVKGERTAPPRSRRSRCATSAEERSTSLPPPAQPKERIPFKDRYSATIDDSVEGTGASRSRIYELIKAEKVKIVRNGRRPLVIVSSLLAALR
jgi:hypothetical protein